MPDWSTKHHKVTKPTGDDEYFERMSRIIFNAGLNWRVLESKWPGTKKAFDNFNVDKVAKYDELKIDELMVDPDVIHNLAKIRAIIKNAQEIQKLQTSTARLPNIWHLSKKLARTKCAGPSASALGFWAKAQR